MKCLVLSRSTGGGHNTAARAVVEALQRRGAEAEFLDGARFSNRILRDGAGHTYVAIVKHAPPVFGAVYHVADKFSSADRKFVVHYFCRRGASSMMRYIEAGGFDAIVTTHLFVAEALTYLKNHHGMRQPFYFVATDYTCTPFDEETEPDDFFLPGGTPGAEFLAKGVPEEKAIFTGIPVSAAFRQTLPMEEAKRHLGLPLEQDCYLVMTGSMGFHHSDRLIRALLEQDPAGLPVVLIGSNTRMGEQLTEQFGSRIRTVAFTQEVPAYMDACQLVFSKPGGLSSTEAAVKNVPLVHTEAIPGCETANARYFSAEGMALSGGETEALVARALALAKDPAQRAEMLRRQRENINPNAADDIAEFILKKAGV
ncbi:MAG: glycosyl transferase [Firmicutes bacterium]|nr:glycosyl transferase [Bacillota bacterium]